MDVNVRSFQRCQIPSFGDEPNVMEPDPIDSGSDLFNKINAVLTIIFLKVVEFGCVSHVVEIRFATGYVQVDLIL